MAQTELDRMVIRLMGDGSSYQRMLSQASASTNRVASEVQRAGSKIEAIKASINSVGSSIQSFGSTLTGLGTKLSLAITTPITAFAGWGASLSADAEQAEVAFTVFLKSAEKAKDLLAEIEKFAAVTPFETPEIRDAARSLLAFGLEQEKVMGTLKALGDVSSGIQAPINELAVIFGKVKTEGRVMSDTLNQFSERGIPLIGMLAKQFGVAESGVRKLAEEGRIQFAHLEKAMLDMSGAGGQFEGMMEKQSQTIRGRLSTLRDDIKAVAREIGGDIMQFLNPTLDLTSQLVAWFKRLSPESKRLAAMIAGVAAAAGPLLVGLGIAVTLFGGVVSAIGTLVGALGTILAPATLATTAIVGLATFTLVKLGVAGDMVNWFGEQFTKLKDFVKPAIDGIKNALAAGDLQLAFEIAWAQIQLAWVKGVKPIKEVWEGLMFSVKEMWINTSSWIQEKVIIWRDILLSIWEEVALGFDKFTERMQPGGGQFGTQTAEQRATAEANIAAKEADKNKRMITRANQTAKDLEEVEKNRKKSQEQLTKESGRRMQAIERQIERKQFERNRLVEKARRDAIIAAEEAMRVGGGAPKPTDVKVDTPAMMAEKAKKAQPKEARSAVDIRSAEAFWRVQDYRARLRAGGGTRDERNEKNIEKTAKNTERMVDFFEKGPTTSIVLNPANLNG